MLPVLTPQAAAERERAISRYGVLDTPPDEHYDALARLVARACGTSAGAVSLADASRLVFKAEHGSDLREVPLATALCAWAMSEPSGLLVVPDTAADPRLRELPAVVSGVRFYAARVLRDPDGVPLGTLCVLDPEPRPGLAPEQLEALQTLGAAVEAQLELGRAPSPDALAPVPVALRRALAEPQLVTHLQPLWAVEEDEHGLVTRLSGAEALVRWQHPERGLLLPGAFLPDVEACGLGGELGELVLRSSLLQLARWEAQGRLPEGFRLHVNVSPGQLHRGGVAALVRRLCRETGAAADRLSLEITETALLDVTAFPPAAAQEIVDLGVELVLDDFGTGYSSLTLLRRYPLAGVKVDRSFVQGLGRDPQDEAIVGAVVGLATRLGLSAVCEGVETVAQLEGVLRLGASAVQGFLLGRAAPADVWERTLLPAATVPVRAAS